MITIQNEKMRKSILLNTTEMALSQPKIQFVHHMASKNGNGMCDLCKVSVTCSSAPFTVSMGYVTPKHV